MAIFRKAADFTLEREGGYQDQPQDTGNYVCGRLVGTNWGINAKVLKEYIGKCPLVQDSLDLTREDALTIYKRNYWDKIEGDRLSNQSVAGLIFDMAIHSGVSRAKTLSRDTLGDIGLEGSKYDVKEINRANQETFFNKFKKNREAFLRNLGGYYLKGWLIRLAKFDFKTDWEKNLIIIGGISIVTTFVVYLLIRRKR